MSFWRSIWRSMFPGPLPKVGSSHALLDERDDPWGPAIVAHVSDVKPGWVRYTLGDGTQQWTMRHRCFRSLYEELK